MTAQRCNRRRLRRPLRRRPPGSYGVRQAAFIGVGAMVGAGIFALLGAAGEVAGAAVWLSFLLAGGVAGLQGYSFAKFGIAVPVGRRPARVRGARVRRRPHHRRARLADPRRQRHRHRNGRGVVRQLRQLGRSPTAGGVDQGLRGPRRAGDERAQHGRLDGRRPCPDGGGGRRDRHPHRVLGGDARPTSTRISSPSPGYPSFDDIVASVALTFFAFLGFGVITFTAKDLARSRPPAPASDVPRPRRSPPSSTSPSSIGVFGTLTVDEVIDVGRHRARGRRRAGARSGRLLDDDASPRCSPPPAPPTPACTRPPACASRWRRSVSSRRAMGRRVGGRAPDRACSSPPESPSSSPSGSTSPSIASIGSVIALVVFGLVSVGHLRVRAETGAKAWVLVLAVASTVVVLVSFVFTTLVDEPATAVALVAILVLCVAIDALWKRARAGTSVRPPNRTRPWCAGDPARPDRHLDRPRRVRRGARLRSRRPRHHRARAAAHRRHLGDPDPRPRRRDGGRDRRLGAGRARGHRGSRRRPRRIACYGVLLSRHDIDLVALALAPATARSSSSPRISGPRRSPSPHVRWAARCAPANGSPAAGWNGARPGRSDPGGATMTTSPITTRDRDPRPADETTVRHAGVRGRVVAPVGRPGSAAAHARRPVRGRSALAGRVRALQAPRPLGVITAPSTSGLACEREHDNCGADDSVSP